MRKLIFLLSFFTGSFLFSQIAIVKEIHFDYDASGNQEVRRYWESHISTDETSDRSMSLSEQFEEILKIYPNPTHGLFYVEWEKEFSAYIDQIEVVSGHALIQKTPVNSTIHQLSVDLTIQEKGIYYVRFFFASAKPLHNLLLLIRKGN